MDYTILEISRSLLQHSWKIIVHLKSLRPSKWRFSKIDKKNSTCFQYLHFNQSYSSTFWTLNFQKFIHRHDHIKMSLIKNKITMFLLFPLKSPHMSPICIYPAWSFNIIYISGMHMNLANFALKNENDGSNHYI